VETALDADEWRTIRDFYGLDESLASRFVMRNEGDRSIFLHSEGVGKLLRTECKLPTRMVMCGVLALQRTGAYHERAIPWKLAQEGLAQLATLGFKRKLACSRSLLRRVLEEKELTFKEVKEAASAGEISGLEALLDSEGNWSPGCLALTLLAGEEQPPPFAISALLSEDCLELQAPAADLAGLIEDLDGQPMVEAILNGTGAEVEQVDLGELPENLEED